MSRVLITGTDGFTGRYLAVALNALGHEVHGIIRHEHVQSITAVHKIHVCDLSDSMGLIEIINTVRPDKVVHLAAIAFVAHSNAEAIYRTNILGTRNLLEAISQAQYTLEAVLLASSANVYGNQVVGSITEKCGFAPVNDYAVSKAAMEYVAMIYADRLPIIICRPFNYTGVGQSRSFLIPKIIEHIRIKAPLIELGNLDVARDFSDVRDVVAAYARLLEIPGAVGETFNICSGTAYSLNDILSLAREISGHDFVVEVNPAFVRENEVKTLFGSRAKLTAILGDRPALPLRQTLEWMLQA